MAFSVKASFLFICETMDAQGFLKLRLSPAGMTEVIGTSTGSYRCYMGCKHKRLRMPDCAMADYCA